jgi:hypothetical protein
MLLTVELRVTVRENAIREKKISPCNGKFT